MLPHAFVALAVGWFAADSSDNAVRKELEKFRGTWKFESLVVNGNTMALDMVKGARLTCDGDKFTYTEKDPSGKDQTSHGTFTIDPSKSPKTIEITFTDGPNKGERLAGVYDITGDTYRVCLAMPGGKPPTSFESKPNSGHVLEVLVREKK